MGNKLRVLIVEDSEDDALLIHHELKRSGYEQIFERVDTAEAMSTALDSKTWDIIISDYTMPGFSGAEALKIMKGKGENLPFIIVAGEIDEETAVDLMKAGAHDYIIKDNLSRLVPIVQRELNEAKIQRESTRAEQTMRESGHKRKRYSTVDNSPVIINGES